MNVLLMTSAAPARAPFSTSEKTPPLGVGFLMAVMKHAGHKVYFSDEYLKPSEILEGDFLARNSIDVVGIYSNTICYQSTLSMFRKLQDKREKKEWGGKIMVGGPHTSVGADTIPDYVDHIVVGEGELTVLDIIDGRETGRMVKGRPVEDMDSLPLPAWEEFIHRPYGWKADFVDSYPVYTFNTSRGCPFGCTFCSVNAVWGRTYRSMSAGRIVDDIVHMMKYYGAKGIYFREDHFTLSKKRTVEFCELLLKKGIKIDWLCETRADQLEDKEYQTLMAKAGCRAFYIGVESGSQRMLDFFNKGEKVEQFEKAFDIARAVGIKTYASFVIGAPTETEQDLQQTEALISRLKPDFVGRNIFVGIPGSSLYDYVLEKRLYEYRDENNVLYLQGHDQKVDRFYWGDNKFKIPGRGQEKRCGESGFLCKLLRSVTRTFCPRDNV